MDRDCMDKLKRVSRRMELQTDVDALDLFQEGCLRLWQTGLMSSAYGAMKEFQRKEMAERDAVRDAAQCHKQLRWSSRSFEGLDIAIDTLDAEQQSMVREWLDGVSLSAIGHTRGLHNKTIKRRLAAAFTAIAVWCGMEGINLEACFPVLERLLPKGIRFRDGKYVACAGHSGKVYLGTYDSLEQASEARRRWPGDFVTSPLDAM